MPGEYDTTTVYTSDDREKLTFAQIAMAAVKDPGVEVEGSKKSSPVEGVEYTLPTDE